MINRCCRILLGLGIVAGMLFLMQCKKSKVTANPSTTLSCDSTHVKYTSCIKPILSKYCVSCHATGNTSGGLALDNYEIAKAVALDGDLWGTVEHLDGYPYMPPQPARIDSASRLLIKNWIQLKAPQ